MCAVFICLVFIVKWNHSCFVVFFNFSYKNEKQKTCTVIHFSFFCVKMKSERNNLKPRAVFGILFFNLSRKRKSILYTRIKNLLSRYIVYKSLRLNVPQETCF